MKEGRKGFNKRGMNHWTGTHLQMTHLVRFNSHIGASLSPSGSLSLSLSLSIYIYIERERELSPSLSIYRERGRQRERERESSHMGLPVYVALGKSDESRRPFTGALKHLQALCV